METFDEDLVHYQEEHQSTGCKITHLFGVPLLAASLPLLFLRPRMAVRLFVIGLILQLAGHYLFEHNRPVLATKDKSLMTYLSALVFVVGEWKSVLTGHGLNGASSPKDA